MSVVFSVPLLLNCMFIVVSIEVCFYEKPGQRSFNSLKFSHFQGSWLMQATQLMVKVKESQLRQQAKQRKKAEAEKSPEEHKKDD